MPTPPQSPLPYNASVEVPEKDEAETQAELIAQLLKISRTTRQDEKQALRAVHAKSHGLLRATVTVPQGLPPILAQGLFATPGHHAAVMRFSTSPGDLLPDSVSTPRGLALRILDVEGPALPDSHPGVQDFLLVTGKAFSAADAKHFAANLKMLAATTDKGENLKVALSATLRGAEGALEMLGGQSATLKTLGGYPETHILGESFFSQVPIRYGHYIAKIGVVPVAPELTALTDLPLDVSHEFDALRQSVRRYFMSHGGAWEIRAQLCTNLKDMPVEDASKPWPEEASPYVTVARIEAPPQESYSDEQVQAIDKGTAFSPWNGLEAHRPLGSINRVRKGAYEAMAKFRLSANGCPYHADAA